MRRKTNKKKAQRARKTAKLGGGKNWNNFLIWTSRAEVSLIAKINNKEM